MEEAVAIFITLQQGTENISSLILFTISLQYQTDNIDLNFQAIELFENSARVWGQIHRQNESLKWQEPNVLLAVSQTSVR